MFLEFTYIYICKLLLEQKIQQNCPKTKIILEAMGHMYICRRRMKTEEKAKVIAAAWGTELPR